MADKVGMSLDQIIKLGKNRGSWTRGRGARGRGGTSRGGASTRGQKQASVSTQGVASGRGRGQFSRRGRGGIGRGGRGARNTVSARTDFSPRRIGNAAPVVDAREKLKFKVDAREKLRKKAAAKTNVKSKVDAKLGGEKILEKKIFQDIRKEKRANTFNKGRTFDVSNTGFKITTKEDDREAKLLNNSIRITAKAAVPSTPLSFPNNPILSATTTKPRTLVGDGTVRVLMNNRQKSLPSLPKMNLPLVDPPNSSDLLAERLGGIDEAPLVSQNKMVNGTRIIITNLHHQVSQRDIQELFGVIGHLLGAKLIRPGVAEVVYSKRDDAVAALHKYHNRNLDGMPMQCKISSLPSQPLYSPPTTRTDRLAADNRSSVVFKVKI